MDLTVAAAKARDDSHRWFPDTTDNLFFTAACMSGETGEVLNLLKKVERGSYSLLDVADTLKEEIADVFTYMLKLVGELNHLGYKVDLETEYYRKQVVNEDRFGTAEDPYE